MSWHGRIFEAVTPARPKSSARRIVSPIQPVSRPLLAAAVGDATLAERITVRVSTKARRVSLRIDPSSGGIVLVQPRRMSAKAVLEFTAEKRNWIASQLASLPARTVFADGAVISLCGRDHRIRFATDLRGGVTAANGEIVVCGRTEHGPRRLIDWLKAQARARIAAQARAMAARLDRKVTRVSVRDTISRWGSCTRSGRLSFSWRLILAPEAVLTYVVAHEVAHLRHMNHGPAFWRTVDELLDGMGSAASARHWLRRHGAILHSYG
jgi:predicted metal-dependent hydrolase